MKKQLLILLAAILAMASSSPAWAYDFSAVAPSGQTLYYNIVDSHAEVVRPGTGSTYDNYVTGNLVIPASVTYNGTTYPVTALAFVSYGSFENYGTFEYCGDLTSVTIPNSVTSIGDWAFHECCRLTSVTIPNSVTSIGNNAFDYCIRLTSVTIPNSVTSIGNYAFGLCRHLTSVTIPNSVTSIGQGVFMDCPDLTSVTIPNSVTSIGNYAFGGCFRLTSVTIPNSVTSIGNDAFDWVKHIEYYGSATGSPWGAHSMNGVTVGDFVYSNSAHDTLIAYIGNGGDVTIPTSVTSIANYAFYGCIGLTSVTIPNSVTSIGNYAFGECSGLTSVTIPNSVTSIGNDAFYNVRYIEYHGSATGSPWGAISMNGITEGDFVFSDATKQVLLAYSGAGGSVVIPSTVGTIGEYAFYGCRGLTSVTIPNSVTSIGYMAFWECRGLTSVTIPNSVTSIGDVAFGECTGLTSVNFNATNCTTMGPADNSVFVDCTNLATLTIGDNVTRIPSNAFFVYGCSGPDTVYMKPSTPPTLGSNAFTDNTSNRVFILFGCTYNAYYNASSWYSYRSELRRPIIDIDINLAANDVSRGHAAIVPAAGNRNIACDSTAVIQATANYGYHFTQWNDGNTRNPRTITLTQDTAFTAIFDRNVYQLTLRSSNPTMGTVSGSGTYLYLDTVTISAIPNEGYRFLTWSGGNTDNPRTVTVTGNVIYTAFFESLNGISDVDAADIAIFVSDGRIVAHGAEGMEMRVFDIMGREVMHPTHNGETPVMPAGVYLVKVGAYPARKVVVIR